MAAVASAAGRRSGARARVRSGVVLGALGALVTFTGPALLAGPADAAPARVPAPGIALGGGAETSRALAALRVASRPGALARQAAARRALPSRYSSPLSGPTTTYFAVQPQAYGAGDVVRFRTDGRAHVSRRDVVLPASSESVLVPTSALGWTLLATEVGYQGQNVVTVVGGRVRALTSDGHSAFGMLAPSNRVLFVTTNDAGDANGLAEVDLRGGGRRVVFAERDRDAVLSLPALSADGRTAFLVRNVYDRRGLPQSSLLSIDVRTGRVSSRALPGINYVTSVAASPNGRDLAFVGYRMADNLFGRFLGFRAEADVLPLSGGSARRVSWVDQSSVLFSRGGSRLVLGSEGRLVSVGVSTPARDPLFGTEGLSLPVLAR